jgi:outer membrane protein
MIKKVVFTALMVVAAAATFAQSKVAHINTTELLQMMPDVKRIDSTIAAREKMYQDQLTRLGNKLQSDYQQLMQDAQDTSFPAEIIQFREKQFQKDQASYQEMQKQAQQDLQALQQKLYEPLTKKVKAIIEEVAKANGYTMVMDSSQGFGMIWGAESDDLMNAVKAKLGI